MSETKLILLLDKHAPYGFHIHHRLPEEHSEREQLKCRNHEAATRFFMSLVERIVDEEE